MACPVTKTLRIVFTAPNPVPSSGYRIKWRVVGSSTYITEAGPFLSSPATINNVPACEDVEGTVEGVCGGVYSSVVSFTATKEQSVVCGGTFSGSILSSSFVIYPKKLIDLQGSADAITLSYDATTIPNRFNLYNSENALIVSSGWKGTAAYSGPWGASLSTSSTGTITFNKSTAGGDQRWYYLTTEHAGNANTTDSWSATLSCAAAPGGGGGGGSTPTYAITPSVTSVNEGGTVTFTVTTANVANGTTLYYTTSGSAVAGDFSDNSTFGTVVINNNTGTITRTITSDTITEGSENFTLSIRTGSAVGTIVATAAAVTIADTSTTPAQVTYYNVTACTGGGTGVLRYDGPNNLSSGVVVKSDNGNCYTIGAVSGTTTQSSGIYVAEHSDCTSCEAAAAPTATYAIAPNVTSVNEGGSVTFTVTTTNVTNGTTLYWVTNGGVGLAASDFSGGSLTGQVTITNNTATIVRTLVNDTTTEGSETFSLALKTVSTSGPTVATSATVTIGDTSTTPVTTYNIGVALNAGSAGTTDCLGTSYSTATNYVTATLYNNSGTPVNATSNITVTFRQSYTPCTGGNPSAQTSTVTILAGQSSGNSAIWTSNTTVDCGQYGCNQETTQYDCVVSNSAGYNWAAGTTVCNP